MITCSSRNYTTTKLLKFGGERLSIFHYLLLIFFKLWLECFSKSNCFCGNKIFMRSSLKSRKNHAINGFCILFLTEDDSSSWSSESFMSRRSNYVTIWNRIFYDSCCYQTCYMGNIGKKISSNSICNFSKTLPIKIS